MEVLRPRHLAFEDVSGSFVAADAKPAPKALAFKSTEELITKLMSCESTIREAHATMQQRLDDRLASVADLLDTTGGKLAVETHVSGQKSNWKFQGARQAFMEELKALHGIRDLLDRDIASESSLTRKEVNVLKSKIRDLNAAINQTEQEAVAIIQQLMRAHESAARQASHAAAQVPHIEAELREYAAKREEPPGAAADGVNEEEVLRQLAEEEERAAKLEQQAAENAANRGAIETKYSTCVEALRALRNEVRDLEEECDTEAKKQGAQHAERLQRFEALASALGRFTGVELADNDETSLNVTITQTIPRTMPGREQSTGAGASQPAAAYSEDPACSAVEAAAGGGSAVEVIEHVLTLQFEDTSSVQLRAANLDPPAVDIDEAFNAAIAAQHEMDGAGAAVALAELVLDVKARIRKHCRRQLQLEDAEAEYPLRATSVSMELLLCVLAESVEVEVLVPMGWPEEMTERLQLVDMQAPSASQDVAPLLVRLQQELREAYEGNGTGGALAALRRRQLQNCSLRELLSWVNTSLKAEQGSAGRGAA